MLYEVITDILDLSKIEAEKLVLEEIPFATRGLFENILSMLNERASQKGLQIRLELDELPPVLKGDPTRLSQALLNFATNAIKFSERGTITLRARMIEESDDSVMLRFEVEDQGIGLKPEEIGKLFQQFEQADNSTVITSYSIHYTKLYELLAGGPGVME